MTVEFIRDFKCYEAGQKADVRDAIAQAWIEHGLAREIVQENKVFTENERSNKDKTGAGGGVYPPFPRLPAL